MSSTPKINIAIEGKSASGKGTLAQSLAKKLGYHVMDSGSLYRALAKYCLENEVKFNDEVSIKEAILPILLEYKLDTDTHTFGPFINNISYRNNIRTDEISQIASKISGYKSVREKVIQVQKEFATRKGVIIDGRAVAEESMPNAEAIFYLTASDEVRAQRRFQESPDKEKVSYQDLLYSIIERDRFDENKTIGAAKMHSRACIIDTTNLSSDEVANVALRKINEIISQKSF